MCALDLVYPQNSCSLNFFFLLLVAAAGFFLYPVCVVISVASSAVLDPCSWLPLKAGGKVWSTVLLLGEAQCYLVFCLVWMPWFSISVPQLKWSMKEHDLVLSVFPRSNHKLEKEGGSRGDVSPFITERMSTMNYSQWILNRHWE